MTSGNPRQDLAQRILRGVFEMLLQQPTGTLDSAPFANVSTDATGRRFIIKGWVDILHGPAVRFSAPWGDLANGQVQYQPDPKSDWEDVEEQGADLNQDWNGITLAVDFNRRPDGPLQRAIFTASIPLAKVVE